VSRLICRKPLYKALAEKFLAAPAMPVAEEPPKVPAESSRS
jgi:hypothetical protein